MAYALTSFTLPPIVLVPRNLLLLFYVVFYERIRGTRLALTERPFVLRATSPRFTRSFRNDRY